MSMIINCTLVYNFSAALIDLTMLLSDFKGVRRAIQPSSLGGFRENSASANSSGNSLEMDFEVSVDMSLVIHDEISSEISFETESG